MKPGLSIIIPAHNEADYIGACLEALLASGPVASAVEVLMAANGCEDDTVARAREFADQFAARGWGYEVLELAQGGKMGALNAGDERARYAARAYLDADVSVSPALVGQLSEALLRNDAASYVSGTPVIAPAQAAVTRAYARFWQTLPFVTDGVPGFGLFAVNQAGRARWDDFPNIISDDTFVRLNFTPAERVRVPAIYTWPMIEGFAPLVIVRRRQDHGVTEIRQRFPALMGNDDPTPITLPPLWRRFASDPMGFVVYAVVALATRLPHRDKDTWARGR
ncbi:glycosyl transferase [Sulfitobacter sp. SK012]|uniref:glycosyltransferase family 2 protein n=1 Tax=Sulfitobacter sp. SK012 TaxID=1389005 RepID=UPI000E0BD31C|nr:glycosyltransferase [Sulfitobacter sp. SK012]AXI45927.1 glycosyl transferase [Sulfitobacter sp. SK012]